MSLVGCGGFGMVVFLVLCAWLLDSLGLVDCGGFVFRFALQSRLLLLFWCYCVSLLVCRFGD